MLVIGQRADFGEAHAAVQQVLPGFFHFYIGQHSKHDCSEKFFKAFFESEFIGSGFVCQAVERVSIDPKACVQ